MQHPGSAPWILIASLLCAGCASTSLTLDVDLYTENPSYQVPLTSEQVADLYQGLNLIDHEAPILAEERKTLAQDLYKTLETYQKLIKLKRELLDPTRTDLKTYEDDINNKRDETLALSSMARDRIDAYLALRDDQAKSPSKLDRVLDNVLDNARTRLPERIVVAQVEALRSVRAASNALLSLGHPLNNNFEKNVIKKWGLIVNFAGAEEYQGYAELDTASQTFKDFQDSARELASMIQKVRTRRTQTTSRIAQTLLDTSEMGTSESAFNRTLDRIATTVGTLDQINVGDNGEAALNRIGRATSLYFSQVHRLQDPADPVWRILTAPENKEKWNTEFSNTYFYAQGNSSVVVARDAPADFRVQRGKNNPTALIQGQLQVSRAIATAAIDVAGGFMGLTSLPEAGSVEEPDKDEKKKAVGVEQNASEEFARRRAAIEQQALLRTQRLENLRANLESLKRAFTELSPDDSERKTELLKEFERVLEAQARLIDKEDPPENEGVQPPENEGESPENEENDNPENENGGL